MANKLFSALLKGTYVGATAYTVGDIVDYGGSSYACKVNTTGNLPTDTSKWALLAEKGLDASGDVIAPASNTANYIPQWNGANSKTLKDGVAVPTGGLAGLTSPSFTTPVLGAATATTINTLSVGLGGNSIATNTAIGVSVLAGSNSGIGYNTAIGYESLKANIGGQDNVALGALSLTANTEGERNTASGIASLGANTTGNDNTASGYYSLGADTEGVSNTGVGASSLRNTSTGNYNTSLGAYSLAGNGTGSSNVALGYSAGRFETGSNAFYVDNQSRTNTAGDKAGALLYGTFSATPASQTLVTNSTFTATYGIKQRVVTTTDDATAVINVGITDVYELSAVANATEFTLTGTPTDGQKLIVRLKDAGVAKGLTWTGFTGIGVVLPTTTVAGKWHIIGCMYNSAASQWQVVAVIVEA